MPDTSVEEKPKDLKPENVLPGQVLPAGLYHSLDLAYVLALVFGGCCAYVSPRWIIIEAYILLGTSGHMRRS
jgi:hypothetical protein